MLFVPDDPNSMLHPLPAGPRKMRYASASAAAQLSVPLVAIPVAPSAGATVFGIVVGHPMVVVFDELLFDAFESAVDAVTFATFVIGLAPVCPTVYFAEMVIVCPTASDGIVQGKGVVQAPLFATKVRRDGGMSSTTTAFATIGPRFVTEIV